MPDKTADRADIPMTSSETPSSSTATNHLPAVYRDMHSVEINFLYSDDESSDAGARLPAEGSTQTDFFELVAMNFVQDDQRSDVASARLPANEESRENQLVSAMQSCLVAAPSSGPRARGQPRGHQARSPAATSQAHRGRQEPSVSHDAHLAEVRLRHVGASRQRACKLESKF